MTDVVFPLLQDFNVSNNATWDVRFAAPSQDVNGAPFDLANKSLHAQLRPVAGAADVILDASTVNGFLTIYNPNQWGFSVAAADAAAIASASYVYDVLATLPNDPRVWRIQKGNAVVDEGVTR